MCVFMRMLELLLCLCVAVYRGVVSATSYEGGPRVLNLGPKLLSRELSSLLKPGERLRIGATKGQAVATNAKRAFVSRNEGVDEGVKCSLRRLQARYHNTTGPVRLRPRCCG